MSRVVILSILAACVAIVWSIQCPENYCDTVDCATAVEDGHQPPCNDNQVLTNRSFCECCEVCVTLVGESEHCGVYVDTTMVPIPYDCQEGLSCVKNSFILGLCEDNAE